MDLRIFRIYSEFSWNFSSIGSLDDLSECYRHSWKGELQALTGLSLRIPQQAEMVVSSLLLVSMMFVESLSLSPPNCGSPVIVRVIFCPFCPSQGLYQILRKAEFMDSRWLWEFPMHTLSPWVQLGDSCCEWWQNLIKSSIRFYPFVCGVGVVFVELQGATRLMSPTLSLIRSNPLVSLFSIPLLRWFPVIWSCANLLISWNSRVIYWSGMDGDGAPAVHVKTGLR